MAQLDLRNCLAPKRVQLILDEDDFWYLWNILQSVWRDAMWTVITAEVL